MLEKNVAIITGGSEGIGFGIASALASKGVHVYLIARTKEKLKKAKEKITQQGGKADIIPADITDIEAMKKVVEDVYEKNNRLDIFINNAGTWKGQSLSTPFSDIWKLIEFDMKAPYELTHYLINKFKNEKNDLKILTIASQAALKVMDFGLGYGPAKMGLVAGLFHLEEELKRENIRNIRLYRLYPNTVATDKMRDAIKANQVQDPVKLEAVTDTAIDLLTDQTPTRDVRIGYYPKKGIVRTYMPSDPKMFYGYSETNEEVVDPNFTPKDLFVTDK